MKLYQLVAHGSMLYFEGGHRFHSQRIFTSREAAEAYKPEFIKNCTVEAGEASDLWILEKVDEVKIIELETYDESGPVNFARIVFSGKAKPNLSGLNWDDDGIYVED